MTKRRRATSYKTTTKKPTKRSKKMTTLESFPKLGRDEIVQVLSFLELPSILSFKCSAKEYYALLGTDPHLTQRMFNLALKTVPPISRIESEESEQTIEMLQAAIYSLAQREWDAKMAIWNSKLSKYRQIPEHVLTAKQVETYQKLIEEMAEDYTHSKIDMKTSSPYTTFLSSLQFYLDSMEDSGDPASQYGPWPIRMVMGYILQGNDLTVVERDRFITELIDNRIGTVHNY